MSDEKMKDLTEGELMMWLERPANISVKDTKRAIRMALAAIKQSPEAEGAGELPKLFVAQGTVEFYIMADGEAQLTKSQAAEVIRRVEAYDTLAAENARLRERLRLCGVYGSGFIQDKNCGAPGVPGTGESNGLPIADFVEETLATPTSPWLTEKLKCQACGGDCVPWSRMDAMSREIAAEAERHAKVEANYHAELTRLHATPDHLRETALRAATKAIQDYGHPSPYEPGLHNPGWSRPEWAAKEAASVVDGLKLGEG